VKICDGLAKFWNAGAGEIALARGVLNQRVDDFGVGRKAGLAKSQVEDGLAFGPHLANAFVDEQCGRGGKTVAQTRRE
jgi:hypothetical protein